MYPPPSGSVLTEVQARALDDTFLTSDPLQYFASRIVALALAYDSAPPTDALRAPASTHNEVLRLLGRPVLSGPRAARDVHAQVAADALAVRHHAAEALVRLASVRLAPAEVSVRCLWAELASSPQTISAVIDRIHAAPKDDAARRWFEAVVPPDLRDQGRTDTELLEGCNVLLRWLDYASRLLRTAPIDQHAAHNKYKHGLAVRARSDLLAVFTHTPPNPDGTMPLSAVTGPGALSLFDQPVLEFLTQGTKVDGHRQGLEVTQLRVKPSVVLAEAYMLAVTHATLFHVAAVEHLAGRDDLAEHEVAPALPDYPVDGPRPGDFELDDALVGIRMPLTTPAGGGSARDAVLGYPASYVPFRVDYDSGRTATIVDG